MTPFRHFRQARFCCIAENPGRAVNRLVTPQAQLLLLQSLGVPMEKTLFALSLGFGGVILATQAAEAAQCASRAQIIARLATGHDETRQGAGLTTGTDGRAQLVEVFASEAGSWTITVTLPDGLTCLVAAGQNWDAIADTPKLGDEPA